MNGGSCVVDEDFGYRCECASGWLGFTCGDPDDTSPNGAEGCSSLPCENDGMLQHMPMLTRTRARTHTIFLSLFWAHPYKTK